MEQATFAELEHDSKRRRTRREIFLEKMDRLVPWKRLEKRVEAFYPTRGARKFEAEVARKSLCNGARPAGAKNPAQLRPTAQRVTVRRSTRGRPFELRQWLAS